MWLKRIAMEPVELFLRQFFPGEIEIKCYIMKIKLQKTVS